MPLFGLFKSKSEREMEAQLKLRQGKSRINRFIQQSRKAGDRYWQLARQAYKLGDQEQFKHLAAAYLRTRESINRWERHLVKLDTLEMRRNEVAATGDFLKSIEAMTASIMRGAKPEDIQKMQMGLEKAVQNTDALEQMLDVTMETAGASLSGSSELSDDVLNQITAGMEGDVGGTGQQQVSDADLDAKINAAMKQMEGEVK